MPKVAIIISPNYADHARRYLGDCLESLRAQDWPGEKKIFITDNESTEESFSYLRTTAPEAEIIRNPTNDGFAKGNNDAIRVALEAGYEFLVLFNMDTIIEADCVSQLVKRAESGKTIGAVQARIMLWPDKKKINSLGNRIHFLGFGYCEEYGNDASNLDLQSVSDICCPSGCAVLYKKEALEVVGLFDETFWMYFEDHDLGWRIRLAGWRCVLAPEAVAHHKYEFPVAPQTYYLRDRNRLLSMIKNYRTSTLLLISPAFVLMELGVLLFAWQNGWLRKKFEVYFYFFSLKHWKVALAKRRRSQKMRRLKDRDIIGMFSGKIWYDEIGDWKLRLANAFLNAYWNIILRMLGLKPARTE